MKTELVDLQNLLGALEGHRVLVVGDVMLDEYLLGGVRRVSPEAPVLVVDVEREQWAPGGAANVAANVRALGGNVSIIGIVGKDAAGAHLREELDSIGVSTRRLLEDPARHTTLKTRIMAGGQQVVRVDREKRERPDSRLQRALAQAVAAEMEDAEAVVFSDYAKGMAGQIVPDIIESARRMGRVFTSNPKPVNLRWFHGAQLVTLNHPEAEAASGETIDSDASVDRAGAKILEKVNAEIVIITRGAQGMSIYRKGAPPEHIPVMPVEVFDVAGAGDSVISTLTLALAAGADVVMAARLANFAGASVVRKTGVAAASPAEVAHLIRESGRAPGE